MAQADAIAEALWPDSDVRGRNTVRHYVHALRSVLEPERKRRAPSSFIVARQGGYGINPDKVWIDAWEFEDLVARGLSAAFSDERDAAVARLEQAIALYQGDFIADEPYAEWAFSDRERLRELAGRALRALVEFKLRSDNLDEAADYSSRLAELDPYDSDAQRQYIQICLSRGRRSEARRRYELFRKRVLTEFGEGPEFSLSEVAKDV